MVVFRDPSVVVQGVTVSSVVVPGVTVDVVVSSAIVDVVVSSAIVDVVVDSSTTSGNGLQCMLWTRRQINSETFIFCGSVY